MPSKAAKKAKMWEMKCCSVVESLSQSMVSAERSISLAVQKDALAFLYIRQMLLCWMGKRAKRWGFIWSSGSGARQPLVSAVLYFDAFCCGGRGLITFLAERVVLLQNLSKLPPLSRMKLVILQKAWYEMACLSGMVFFGVCDDGGVAVLCQEEVVCGGKGAGGGFLVIFVCGRSWGVIT